MVLKKCQVAAVQIQATLILFAVYRDGCACFLPAVARVLFLQFLQARRGPRFSSSLFCGGGRVVFLFVCVGFFLAVPVSMACWNTTTCSLKFLLIYAVCHLNTCAECAHVWHGFRSTVTVHIRLSGTVSRCALHLLELNLVDFFRLFVFCEVQDPVLCVWYRVFYAENRSVGLQYA